MIYNCEWCGRFYSSELPDQTACRDHVHEHSERMRAAIERHNLKFCGFPVRLDPSMPRDEVRFEDKRGNVVGAFKVNQ